MNVEEVEKKIKSKIGYQILEDEVVNSDKYIYLSVTNEDDEKFYFDIAAIPNSIKRSDVTKKIAQDNIVEPCWYVDKKTGEADINWGPPPKE